MPATLYQELIDLIIDQTVDFDHKKSLFACSLISGSFHSSARKHIFRQISISQRGQLPFREKQRTRLENLINILTSDSSRSRPVSSPCHQMSDLWIYFSCNRPSRSYILATLTKFKVAGTTSSLVYQFFYSTFQAFRDLLSTQCRA